MPVTYRLDGPATCLAIAIAIAAGGCGSKPRAATPEPAYSNDPQVLAGNVKDALGEMVTAAEAHPAKCPEMARALTVVFDRVRPLFDHVQLLAKDAEAARELTAAFKQHAQAAEALAGRLSTAINTCHGDAAVGDAMAKMPVL